MDCDSTEDDLMVKQGLADANRIKDAIDSKLHEQANDGPAKPSSPGPAASGTYNKETSSPQPAANTNYDKKPITLATPSPVTTKTTQSRKWNLSDESSDDMVPEIDNGKLKDIVNRFDE